MTAGLDVSSLALLTDLYQLTMAQGYWRKGLDRHEAVFHLYFRKEPFGGGYAIAGGIEPAAGLIERLRFTEDDLAYLGGLSAPRGPFRSADSQYRNAPGTAGSGVVPAASDGEPLFQAAFLDHLRGLRFGCDVDAVPEGTAVFGHEPLLRVRGPLLQCQLLETALLNLVNFSTLIATKASRVVLAARGAPVLEFGLRRAQGVDGALTASRAAYIGGCAATSNVLAGKLFGIPVRGTHAHSWVMAFGDEAEAFEAYAESVPGDPVFLVDTYDALEGVRRAIEVGRRLRARGRRLAGIRLDSGDLADLSRRARELLDEAGFTDAFISATDDLDERRISDLLGRGAAVTVWGVGTRLVTGDGQPALGGVYKLGAIRAPGGEWRDVAKSSEDPGKSSLPGCLQVRRFTSGARPARDVVYALGSPPRMPQAGWTWEDLLVPLFRAGRRVLPSGSLESARLRAKAQLAALPPGTLRLSSPERYPVELEPGLAERRAGLLRPNVGVR